MFTGPIPDFTGTPDLTFLSLANNELTGSIPASVGSLPLSTFSVIENDLDECFDPALNELCSNSNIIWQAINPGNNFDAQWSDFCATGAGSCCSIDIAPPVLDCPVGLLTLEIDVNGQASAGPSDFNITVTDDCDPSVSITNATFSVDCSDVGGPAQYKTVMATDAAGNTSTCTVGVEITDPNSYCCSHPDLPGLQAFYDDANGDMWDNTLANDRPWFEDCDPCGLIDGTTWFGIGCDGNNNVTALGLNNNNLSGTISSDIDQLQNLSSAILYDNPDLSGSIPSSICNLSSFTTFYIFRNSHSGDIPPCMANMSSLVDLNFDDNNLTGTIPSFGATNPNLGNLNLNNNMLSGGLPASLADIPNPSTLTFNDNMLAGCYPSVLMDLCNANNGTLQGLDNSTVSDGNGFDADWEDFCSIGAGACTVSTNESLISRIHIYPTVSTGLFTIETEGISKFFFSVYTITGQQVTSITSVEEKVTLDLSGQGDGLYLIQVRGENRSITTYKVLVVR